LQHKFAAKKKPPAIVLDPLDPSPGRFMVVRAREAFQGSSSDPNGLPLAHETARINGSEVPMGL
jgi:hypothetical protein